MRKKVLAAVLALSVIGGTAYAFSGIPIVVNGKLIAAQGTAVNGSTMVPLRAVGEALGASANWDSMNKRVVITTPQTANTGLTLDQLNEIGKSVGMVYALNGAGQTIATGSGFVTSGTLITNAHVVEGASSIRVEFIGETQTYNVSNALFNDAAKDLAGFAYSGSVKSLRINTELPREGETVYSLGFPSRRFHLAEGKVANILNWQGYDEITHRAFQSSGGSGGPVVNTQGEVVAVNDNGTDAAKINGATAIKYVQELINK